MANSGCNVGGSQPCTYSNKFEWHQLFCQPKCIHLHLNADREKKCVQMCVGWIIWQYGFVHIFYAFFLVAFTNRHSRIKKVKLQLTTVKVVINENTEKMENEEMIFYIGIIVISHNRARMVVFMMATIAIDNQWRSYNRHNTNNKNVNHVTIISQVTANLSPLFFRFYYLDGQI